MNQEFREPKYIDFIARSFCFLVTVIAAICAYITYEMPSPNLAFWAFSILSVSFLFLATLAPRNIRVPLVAWLPWL